MIKLLLAKRGDLPGWAQIVALVIALMALFFLVWLAVKSGKTGSEIFARIPP